MGGAPCLADDIRGLRADLWISANEHGAKLRPVDYFLALDHEHGGEQRPMRDVLRRHSDAPILSPEPYADVRIYGWPGAPRRIYSGLCAAWAAYVMGASAVLLAGFDGYGQQPGYKRKAQIYVQGIHCPVREVGGHLGVWPAYDPAERFEFNLAPQLVTFMGGDGWTYVRAVKRTRLECGVIQPGEVRRVRRDGQFIRNMLRSGILREIDSGEDGQKHGDDYGARGEGHRGGRHAAA